MGLLSQSGTAALLFFLIPAADDPQDAAAGARILGVGEVAESSRGRRRGREDRGADLETASGVLQPSCL
jgi:hypothetical protein